MTAHLDVATTRLQAAARAELEQSLAGLAASHEAALRNAIAATVTERDALLLAAREALAASEEECHAVKQSAARSRLEGEESSRRATSRAADSATAAAEEAADLRNRQELDQAALGALAAEHRASMQASMARAREEKDKAVEAARVDVFERCDLERRATEVRAAEAEAGREAERAESGRVVRRAHEEKREFEARAGREARDARKREADGNCLAVKVAVEAERAELERRHGREVEGVTRAGKVAARAATEAVAKRADVRVAAAERRLEEERGKQLATGAAMKHAANKWGQEVPTRVVLLKNGGGCAGVCRSAMFYLIGSVMILLGT